MNKPEIFHEHRELGKLSLDTFFFEFEENHFDSITDSFVKEKITAIEKLTSKLNGQEITEENYHDDWELIYRKQELRALIEMNILYCFKNFEIKLKMLLTASYKGNHRQLYKWENLVDFFKNRKIDFKKITNYSEVNELRILNNTIKHSQNLVCDETKKIKEFKNKRHIDYADLHKFYARCKNSPSAFISSLSTAISKDLYEFDEDRLEKIADDISKRMDKKDAEILIEKLKKNY